MKESRNFEILLFSLSNLLCASVSYNVEVIPCLFESLSLTLNFLLGGDFISKSFILCLSRRPLLCGTDQTHGFEVQALCCGIMDTLSIAHLAITFETVFECEYVPALPAGH